MGHVYISARVVSLLRGGEIDRAIGAYFAEQGMGVPLRVLRKAVARAVGTWPREAVRQELSGIELDDPAAAFHLFLLFNDQRRHLAAHFEDIDVHRVELQLPFFDSSFLEVVLSAPLDARLGHRWYVGWLSRFPSVVSAVPWQAYPGHVPCPLPVPEGLAYQWDPRSLQSAKRLRGRMLLVEARALIGARDFPHQILRKGRLRLATWVQRLGLQDYGFALGAARTYFDYWRRSGGQLEWRDSAAREQVSADGRRRRGYAQRLAPR